MYNRPIYFRPTEQDSVALRAVADDHPIFAGSPTELLRLALEFYAERRWESGRLDRLEQRIALIEQSLIGD